MTTSDWGDGLPTEIMISLVDIFRANLDGRSFACFGQVAKSWNSVISPTTKEHIELDCCSDFEVLSATKMFTGVRSLRISTSPRNSGILFKHITGFDDIEILFVSKFNLEPYDLLYISRMYTLKKIYLKGVHFHRYGIVSLNRHPNLMYLNLSSHNCNFTVNLFSKSGKYLKLSDMYSKNLIEFCGIYDDFAEDGDIEYDDEGYDSFDD